MQATNAQKADEVGLQRSSNAKAQHFDWVLGCYLDSFQRMALGSLRRAASAEEPIQNAFLSGKAHGKTVLVRSAPIQFKPSIEQSR